MKPNTAFVIIILAFVFATCFAVYITKSGWWLLFLLIWADIEIENKDE